MSPPKLECAVAQRRLEERRDGTLGDRERDELEAHLTECAECQAAALGLEHLEEALDALPELCLPETDLEAVWRRTIDAPWVPRRRAWLLTVTAAAALAILGLVAVERLAAEPEPSAAELAQARLDLQLVAQLTEHALRATQRSAVEAALDRGVSSAVRQVPILRQPLITPSTQRN